MNEKTKGKVEAKSLQDVANFFHDELKSVQAGCRDADYMSFWILNVFLMTLTKKLNEKLSLDLSYETLMADSTEYVTESFEQLKIENEEVNDFQAVMSGMKKVYRRGQGGRKTE